MPLALMRLGCLVLCLAGAAQAAGPYRLFFSPEERAQLEAARNSVKPLAPRAPQTGVTTKPRVATKASPGRERRVRAPEVLTGYVERSSGRNTLWINQRARSVSGDYGAMDPLAVGAAPR